MYDLRAFASEYKEHILLGEYTINQTKDEILKEIYRSGAEVVCFSCYIWNISFVRELIFDLKKILPGTAFWVGGPEVSFDAENFLKEMPQVTGVMWGRRRNLSGACPLLHRKKRDAGRYQGDCVPGKRRDFSQRMAGSNGFKQSSLCL